MTAFGRFSPRRRQDARNGWPCGRVADWCCTISALCLLCPTLACHGSTPTSLLAGNWVLPGAVRNAHDLNPRSASATDLGVASTIFLGPRPRSEVDPSRRRIKGLRIRPDGSFDWSGTFFANLIRLNSLRHVGDSVSVRWQPDAECVVLWSRYTPRSSALALMQRSVSGNDEIPISIAFHSAVLRSPGRLEYRVVEMFGDDETGTAKYELVRSESDCVVNEPFGIVDMMSSARATMHAEYGEIAGGRRFRILLPNGELRPQALIVALHSSFHSDYERTWIPLVDTLRCAILMPELQIESLLLPPSRRSAEQEVAVISECLKRARVRLRPTQIILYAEYGSTFLGHLIWQENNHDFDAFVATSPSFLAWNDVVGESVNRTKPLYLAVDEPDRGGLDRIVNWYENDHGYENVRIMPRPETQVSVSMLVHNLLTAITDDLETAP